MGCALAACVGLVVGRLVVGSLGGGSQKPMAAKHMQALFSAGQQEGHSLPGVKTGFSPSLQKPGCGESGFSPGDAT